MANTKPGHRARGGVCPMAVEALEERRLLSVVPHLKPVAKAKAVPAAHVAVKAPVNTTVKAPVKAAVKTPAKKAAAKKTVAKAAVKTTSALAAATLPNLQAIPGDIVASGPSATPAGVGDPAVAPFTPAQIKQAYGINSISFNSIIGDGAGQTIAVIEAYNDPKFVSSTSPSFSTSDLHQFDLHFGLADPPSFSVIPELGSALPTNYNSGWATETALDVEWTHALAPKANIILVECQSAFQDDLIEQGVPAAQDAGATVISMSFIIAEQSYDTYTTEGDGTFNTAANITYVASTGDNGVADTGYPSFSPYVIAAGGTSLTTSDSAGDYGSEVVWNDSNTTPADGATGGGISEFESKPTYQNSETVSGSNRGVPDVAFDADPQVGVYVLDTSQSGGGGYYRVGGTSFSSPAWAALVAIADEGYTISHGFNASAGLAMDGFNSTLPRLYDLPASDFHDITSGNNTYTPYSSETGYSAGPGYDLASGLGSPVANTLIPDLAGVATVTGRVFVDNNSDGAYDGTDSPLAGQIVYLDLNNDGVLDNNEPMAVTNSSGGYVFTNQSAGGVVRLSSPNIAGYVATTPSAAITYGTTDTINLTYFPISYSTTATNTNYTLEMDPTGTLDQIAVNGTVQYSVAKSLLSTLSFSLTGAGDSLTVDGTNGNPIPSGGITFTGAASGDALTVIGTAAGNDAFNVSSSSISFGTNLISFSHVSALTLNPGAGTDSLNVSSGSVTIAARNSGSGILVRNFSSLSVASGASAKFATAAVHANRMLVEASSLAVIGQLDLGGNDMIVHFASLTAVNSLLTSGYANGNWNGNGLASAATAGDTTHLTALGVISNNLGGGNTLYGGAGQSLFDGQAPLASDILIKYTYYGDTNLDGKVDGTDYGRIDNGALMNLTGWFNGDFNYDSTLNGSDYSLIDNAYNTQAAEL